MQSLTVDLSSLYLKQNFWSPSAYRAPLKDKQTRCRDEQLVITDNLVPYPALSYTPRWLSSLIFDNRVYTSLMHGTHHSNYYHSSQTLGDELCDSEAPRAFQPRPYYTTLTSLL